MTTFQLDTSGSVLLTLPPNDVFKHVFWPDLVPFTQGYVEALFANLRDGDLGYLPLASIKRDLRFDRLAPATLAQIMADCERARKVLDSYPGRPDLETLQGRDFWNARQAGGANHWANAVVPFPPLTPYLGDDGLIYLKDAT